jgi:hypothetical protein
MLVATQTNETPSVPVTFQEDSHSLPVVCVSFVLYRTNALFVTQEKGAMCIILARHILDESTQPKKDLCTSCISDGEILGISSATSRDSRQKRPMLPQSRWSLTRRCFRCPVGSTFQEALVGLSVDLTGVEIYSTVEMLRVESLSHWSKRIDCFIGNGFQAQGCSSYTM